MEAIAAPQRKVATSVSQSYSNEHSWWMDYTGVSDDNRAFSISSAWMGKVASVGRVLSVLGFTIRFECVRACQMRERHFGRKK
jgi:hypothetical protein